MSNFPNYPQLACGARALLHPLAPNNDNAFNPCFLTFVFASFSIIAIILGSVTLITTIKESPKYGTYSSKLTGLNHYVRVSLVLFHGLLFLYITTFNNIHERLADTKILSFSLITINLLLVILPLHFIETSYRVIPFDYLLLFWPNFLIIEIVLFFQDNFTSWRLIKSVEYGGAISIIEGILILNTIVIFYLEYSKSFWKPNKELTFQLIKNGQEKQLDQHNVIDRITLNWMNPIIVSTFKKQYLDESELPQIPAGVSTVANTEILAKHWNNRKSGSLLSCLIGSYGFQIFIAIVFEFMGRLLNFVNPQLLRLFIKFFDNKDAPILQGILIAIGIFSVTIVQTSLSNEYILRALQVGLGSRSALTALIYQKSLKLSPEAKLKTSSGDIINLIAVDLTRLQTVTQSLSTLFLGPLDVILCLISLWPLLGKSTLAGIFVMVLLVPINSILVRYSKDLSKTQMKLKDNRSRIINEILSSIKSIKLYAWEKPMLSKLSESRNEKELKNLGTIRLVNQVGNFIWNLIPFLVSFTSFTTFALTSSTPLTSDIVFPALAIINLLSGPLLEFPTLITSMIEGHVALERITNYLISTEVDDKFITRTTSSTEEYAVKIKNSSFLWSKPKFEDDSESAIQSYNYALHDVNYSAKRGSLSCIVGRVGTGKSSFLYGLLGQLVIVKGDGDSEPSLNINGNIAYCAQSPWIMNASFKENIIFGHRYDEEFYQKTIDACQLLPDLKVLPDGDDTQVGEKGISLSGGQKARLSLARAVYARADIYLLDDVLSAVDSHVGKNLLTQVFSRQTGILSSRTIILNTNSIAALEFADDINLISGGRFIETSSFADINLAHHPKLYELVNEYGNGEKVSKSPSVIDTNTLIATTTEQDDDAAILDQEDESIYDFSPQINAFKGLRRASVASLRYEPSKKLVGTLRSSQIKEVSEKGKVKWSVYLEYARACSLIGVNIWFLLLVFASTVTIGGNYWLKNWTEQNSHAGSNSDVWRFIIVYAILGFGASFANIIRGIVMMLWLGLNASRKIHDRMALRVVKAPMSFFDRTPIGRIMNRFTNDINQIDDNVPRILQDFMGHVMNTLIAFLTVGLIMPWFIIVIFSLSGIYWYYQLYYVSISRELKRLISISTSPIFGHLGETLSGIDTIRAYDQYNRFDYINNANVDFNLRSAYLLRSVQRWLISRLRLIGSLGTFCASLLAIYTVTTKTPLTSSMAGFVMACALQVTNSLRSVVRMSAEVENNIISVERCLEYTTLPVERGEDDDDDLTKFVKPPLHWPQEGEIYFHNYSTRYRENLDLVLKNISLHIKPGEHIGAVGRTGAGKSSLALSIFRIIEAAGGNIEIDRLNTSNMQLYDLRHRLSIIPQDSQLLEGTIRQNLDPFNYYTDEEVWKALELAHLKEHILSLEDKNEDANVEVDVNRSKLEYKVYEGGLNFSSGQRQLMSLARVLLKMSDSQVLVLDEATAAVDVQTDKIIQETIRSEFKSKTIITIAHRLDTVMDSDKIISLDQGQVKEFDSPQNLLNKEDGIFYSLCKQGGYI
ncbi:P-loop containing nucleoside triphosphate hydrolase protein [Scheffersomyces coipomensis]|uniref:P-loop containing nucleoside triphosphate hydrolase protein n=1 Tax=Scheffersomyces coipomensis TaxID=1788519 RepID=UPI00315C7097